VVDRYGISVSQMTTNTYKWKVHNWET
jgi:hypothetical protein